MNQQVIVITVAVDRTTTGGVKSINWDDSSDRKWLMNHLHWAMRNGREVHLVPCNEESN